MSKSKKNIVDPMPIIQQYGADTLRLFITSDTPPERDMDWSYSGLLGTHKFLQKLYKKISLFSQQYKNIQPKQQNIPVPSDVLQHIHLAIKNVSRDINNYHLNRAIAHIRQLDNSLDLLLTSQPHYFHSLYLGYNTLIQLLNPFAPHITEELWLMLDNKIPLSQATWPQHNDAFLVSENVVLPVQLNGKLKTTINVPHDSTKEYVINSVLENHSIQKLLLNITPQKIIVVPNKIVNIVV